MMGNEAGGFKASVAGGVSRRPSSTPPSASVTHDDVASPSPPASLLQWAHLRRVRPFLIWLALFYIAWLMLVALTNGLSMVLSHWPIAVAMALGSYVAGSTPMGGGTIGFPVLVLLFDQPADIGRDFSFAVQSIGMTSAAIFIFATRGRRLAWRLMVWAAIGALATVPVSCALLAPRIDDTFVKILFAVIWASFGIMHFVRLREVTSMHGAVRVHPNWQRFGGLLIGVVGGVVTSVIGVGIDMLVYTLLVVLFRTDMKIAIPTSVVLMAFSSLVGLASNVMLGDIDPEVYRNWLAAAPIVAVGAPVGALIVHYLPRTPTLLFVSGLCVMQFFWTLWDGRVTGWPLIAAFVGLIAFNLLFHVMYLIGGRLPHHHHQMEA